MSSAQPEPLPETPDIDGAFPRLTDAQVQTLAQTGERRPTREGQVLYREGEHCAEFHVVLEGKVASFEGHGRDDARLIAVYGPGRFLGELNLLIGEASFVTAVVREAGAVLAVPVDRLRDIVAGDEALGDLILRAYLQRRSLLIGLGTGLRIIGSRFSPDTRRLREFAARNRIPHRWLDLEDDAEAEQLLRSLGVPAEETPVVIWRGREVLRNPSVAEVARLVGLPAPTPGERCDLVVVGAGPAGLAAGVYGASEGLDTVLLDSVATGGQAGRSPRIENYLGFPSGLSGGELADRAVIQAEKFGAELSVPAEVVGLGRRDGLHVVRLAGGGSVEAHTVLIATGAQYRRLDVPGLERLEGVSVYYAATVVEARQCGGDPVAVVGGGNSAGQASLFLTEYAAKVRLLVRGRDLAENMSRYLVDAIERHPKIEVRLHTEVREILGDDVLRALVVEDNLTGQRERIGARVLFVFVGARPHTAWLDGQLALDGDGFVLTGADAIAAAEDGDGHGPPRHCLLLETSRPGVFAAGDVRHGSIKRVASAVGEGSMSVRMVHEHLAGSHRAPDVADRARARLAAQTYVSSK